MRKNSFIIFFAASFLFACSDKDKLPKGVLPVSQMKEVMWDMIRAGELLDGVAFVKDSSNKAAVSQQWFNKIYELHKIKKEQFEKSYSFYKEHPRLMKEILDSLAKKQVSYQPSPVAPVPSFDSLGRNKNLLPARDSIRKAAIDSLRRKKMIKKKNFKAV
jgi:hypothetical protein